MIERRYVDALIVGGGPAGLAAATGLWYSGIRDILIVEREKHLGGILRQCIHDGFGLTQLGVTLSGPEYAQRYIDDVERMEIPYITNATVLSVTPSRVVTVVSRDGLVEYEAKAVILTMGCRERTRGALAIPGERPTGVFTAGVAQAYINLYNRMPAREVIILGSGDIGMIMARRLTLEGAHVQGVFEVMPYAAGLPRNVEQCLNDYNIPLYLSRTATKIHGSGRVTGVTISEVDAHGKPIPGTEKEYACDTVILSVGLIPENELSLDAGVELDPHTCGAFVDEHYMTGVEGVFAAGNVLHVHDLVDYVSLEAERMAMSAAAYIKDGSLPACPLAVECGENVGHVIPQRVSGTSGFQLSLRVRRPLRGCTIKVTQDGREVFSHKMRKAIPAEMIRLEIPAAGLSASGDLMVEAMGQLEDGGSSGAVGSAGSGAAGSVGSADSGVAGSADCGAVGSADCTSEGR